MIIGVGVDIIEISRIEKILRGKLYHKFLKRIFNEEEFEELNKIKNENKIIHFIANRFVAKEALSKAMGYGIGKLKFTDIITKHDQNGKPYIKKTLVLSEFMRKNHHVRSFEMNISISDTKHNSIGMAVLSTVIK